MNNRNIPTNNPLLPLPSRDASFIPLHSAPVEVKEFVWGRAIDFAMLQEEAYVLEHQFFDRKRDVVKLDIKGHHILRVSKMFHASPNPLPHIIDSKL